MAGRICGPPSWSMQVGSSMASFSDKGSHSPYKDNTQGCGGRGAWERDGGRLGTPLRVHSAFWKGNGSGHGKEQKAPAGALVKLGIQGY